MNTRNLWENIPENGSTHKLEMDSITDNIGLLTESNELTLELMKIVGIRLETLEDMVKKQNEIIISLMK